MSGDEIEGLPAFEPGTFGGRHGPRGAGWNRLIRELRDLGHEVSELADDPVAQILLRNELVDARELREGLQTAEARGRSLAWALVELGHVEEGRLVSVLADALGLPGTDLDRIDHDPRLLDLIPPGLVRTRRVVPLRVRGTRLFLGMVNPRDHSALDEVSSLTGRRVQPVLVGEHALERVLDRWVDETEETGMFELVDEGDSTRSATGGRAGAGPPPAAVGPSGYGPAATSTPEPRPPATSSTEPSAPVPPDEGTDPSRFPSLIADRVLESGEAVVVTVDLLREDTDPNTAGSPVGFHDLPADWESLEVQVEVLALAIDFQDPRGTITVRRNRDSDPATFPGRVAQGLGPGAAVGVDVAFRFRDRLVGMARRTFRVGRPDPDPPPEPSLRVPMVVEGTAGTSLPPHLEVKILRPDPDAPSDLLWSLDLPPGLRERIPGIPDRLTATASLGTDPRGYARELYGGFGAVAVGEHLDLFRGIGDQLWENEAAVPDVFRDTYWALRRELGAGFTVQFITDDPYVPWELMRPTGPGPGERARILALDHPVARWMIRYEGALRQRLARGAIATIAPRYDNPMDELERAQAEARHLIDAHRALPVPGTVEAVKRLFREGVPDGVTIVHFAGHGVFDRDAPSRSAVKLEDGELPAAVVGARETTLGERSGALVVFNACEVGLTGESLGTTGGWADVFLKRRFRGFIAPLWPVFDAAAETVITELFRGVVERHEPVGRVLQGIRHRHADRSPTFLAYLFYGDVNARIEAPSPPATREPGAA